MDSTCHMEMTDTELIILNVECVVYIYLFKVAYIFLMWHLWSHISHHPSPRHTSSQISNSSPRCMTSFMDDPILMMMMVHGSRIFLMQFWIFIHLQFKFSVPIWIFFNHSRYYSMNHKNFINRMWLPNSFRRFIITVGSLFVRITLNQKDFRITPTTIEWRQQMPNTEC